MTDGVPLCVFLSEYALTALAVCFESSFLSQNRCGCVGPKCRTRETGYKLKRAALIWNSLSK